MAKVELQCCRMRRRQRRRQRQQRQQQGRLRRRPRPMGPAPFRSNGRARHSKSRATDAFGPKATKTTTAPGEGSSRCVSASASDYCAAAINISHLENKQHQPNERPELLELQQKINYNKRICRKDLSLSLLSPAIHRIASNHVNHRYRPAANQKGRPGKVLVVGGSNAVSDSGAMFASVEAQPQPQSQSQSQSQPQPQSQTETISAQSTSSLLPGRVRRSDRLQSSQSQQTIMHQSDLRPAGQPLTVRSFLCSAESNTNGIGSASIDTHKQVDQMQLISQASRPHSWHWNEWEKSAACTVGEDKLEVCFHPRSSESTAAIRGSEPLRRNGNYYYWEVCVYDKCYGTSVMFGLCTKQQPMHANDYCNLIGLESSGWSLSHKGFIWHNGQSKQYMRSFPSNESVKLGILFNSMRGELSYFMNGKCLGVAFSGLNDFDDDLYPVIGSTAKCTRMRLVGSYCGYMSLLERSCFTLLKSAPSRLELMVKLYQNRVPKILIDYIADSAQIVNNDNNGNFDERKSEHKLHDSMETNLNTAN